MPGVREIWFYANNIISSARQMVNEELKPLKLGSAEGNVLLHLLSSDDILRQEDLAEELEISKPAISRALVSLEKKGYVRRKKDPDDRRVRRVFLTEKARRIAPEIERVYENIFSVAARGVSEVEIVRFIALFRRISESFSLAREEKKRGEENNDNK